MQPTYGMYQVSAAINDAEVIDVPLTASFQPDVAALRPFFQQPEVKLMFCCSPNNPTGNTMDKAVLQELANSFRGLLVVDEAYVDFCPDKSVLPRLGELPNLVVLQTFSKAWGLAGLRLGAAYASGEIISILDKIKPPYNINAYTQQEVLRQVQQKRHLVAEFREMIAEQRNWLTEQLNELSLVQKVYPSEANFILAVFNQPDLVYQQLVARGIVVRNRNKLVPGTLRITIGTPQENQQLITALKAMNL